MNANKFGKLVGKLVEGKRKISAGNFVDEIAAIFKVGENQYRVLSVACGEIKKDFGTFSADKFVKVGKESDYSASREGYEQYVFKAE